MFTVKLQKGHVTRMVQAEVINIYPAGPRSGTAPLPENRTNDVREIAVLLGNKSSVFYIADGPHPLTSQEWPQDMEFFYCAYIENEQGATTEVVRPY